MVSSLETSSYEEKWKELSMLSQEKRSVKGGKKGFISGTMGQIYFSFQVTSEQFQNFLKHNCWPCV